MKQPAPSSRPSSRVAILLFSLLVMAGCGQSLPPAPADPATSGTETALSLWIELEDPQWPADAAWSPDGRNIVFTSHDEIQAWTTLYDVARRQVIWQTNEGVVSPIFSPDGQFIVSADNRIPFIDVADGSLTQTSAWVGPSNRLFYMAFLPEDSTLVIGETDIYKDETAIADIGLWRPEEKQINSFLNMDSFLHSLSVHPEGNRLAAGFSKVPGVDYGLQVFMWSYPSMTLLCEFPGEEGFFSPTGDLIAVAHREGTIRIFDVQSCELIRSIEADTFYGAFSISPDDHTLAFVEKPCCVLQLLDIATGETLERYPMADKDIKLLAFSPGGQYLLSISGEGLRGTPQYLQIWRVNVEALSTSPGKGPGAIATIASAEPTPVASSSAPPENGPDSPEAIEPPGKYPITLSMSGEVEDYDSFYWASWSPDSQKIVFVGHEKIGYTTTLYDVTRHQSIWQLYEPIGSPIFSPDGRYVVGADFRVPFIDVASGSLTPTSPSLSGGQTDWHTAFLPGDLGLIVGYSFVGRVSNYIETEIGLWDKNNGTQRVFFQTDRSILSINANAAGDMLAAGFFYEEQITGRYQIFLLRYPSMAMLCQLPGERGIFSPAGDVIVTAHRGGSIQLFDIETCELIRSIEAGEHPLAFSISPDGRSLAFAEAACCVIQIQDLATGELLARHSMPGNREITFLAYSPSGEYLLSFSWAAKSTLLQDWRLHTWEVNVAAP